MFTLRQAWATLPQRETLPQSKPRVVTMRGTKLLQFRQARSCTTRNLMIRYKSPSSLSGIAVWQGVAGGARTGLRTEDNVDGQREIGSSAVSGAV